MGTIRLDSEDFFFFFTGPLQRLHKAPCIFYH